MSRLALTRWASGPIVGCGLVSGQEAVLCGEPEDLWRVLRRRVFVRVRMGQVAELPR
jgi:hypothetical protein